jgi:hypothetical protein
VNKNIAFFRSCLNLYRQVFIEQKNSANEQNASLLVSFKASAAYFGAMQIGCLFIFQGHKVPIKRVQRKFIYFAER